MKTVKYRYCKLDIGGSAGGGPLESAFAVSSSSDDFLVAEARMTTGISRLPVAEIEAYSGKTTKDYQELCKLLDSPARLILRQTDKEVLTFSGKISQVKHLGLCHANPRFAPIFRYRLTLTSVLNDMRFVRQSRTFEKQNFESVIREVLSYYKITVDFRCTTTANSDFYNCRRTFYQRSESDYEFFLRVLFMAGWSFRIYTQGGNQQIDQESILITDGNYFTLEGKDTEFQASVSGAEAEGKIVISDWSMESRTGIDSFTGDSSTFKGNEGQRKWFLGGTGSLFANDSDDDAAQKLASHRMDSLNRFLSVNKQCYQGSATSLKLYPGCRIALNGFYGTSGGDVKACITGLEYYVWDRLPEGEGYPEARRAPELKIRISGIDAPAQTAPLFTEVGGTAQEKEAVSDGKAAAVLSGIGGTSGASGGNVFCATVCGQDGSSSGTNDVCTVATEENTNGVFFYAKLDGAAQASLVQFTMPLGGSGQGLYRLPRMGDRIVVMASTEERYILLCYIPTCKTMPFVDKDHIGDSRRMTVLRHNVPAVVPAYFGTAADKADPTVSKDFKYSEIGMYSEGSDEKMRLQTPGYRYDHAEKDHISTAKNFLFSTPNSDDGEFHIAKVNKIHLQADSEIRIQVGRSVITLSEKMIELRVRQAKAAGGPQDSVIYMNPMGVYTSSSRVCVVVLNRIDMEAGLGEVFSMSGGVAGLYARYVNVGTVDSNYLGVSQGFNVIMSLLNMLSFGIGVGDDAQIGSRTYQSLVKNGSIDLDALKNMGASPFDFVTQFLYMGGGMTSTLVALRNAKHPHFATADNSSNLFGTVMSILDSVFSGVLSGLLLIPNLMARTIACDILLFGFSEAKYIYLVARAESIEISNNQISYIRMAGEQTELWTKEVVMDTGKLGLRVFDIPLTAPKSGSIGSIGVDSILDATDIFGNPVNLPVDLAQALVVEEAVAAAQELARGMAQVKIELDRSNIKHTSPSFRGDLDSVTLNSKATVGIKVGNSKITIDAAGLTADLAKLSGKLQQLEMKATQCTWKATVEKVQGESGQLKYQITQIN